MIRRPGWERWRRRRAERRVAAELVSAAILEIRAYATSPHLYQGPGTAAEHIHDIADVVHNLPGGILGGGERCRAWDGPGYHTFLWMWQTASEAQRRWLVAQFTAIGYDYRYLESSPSLSVPATAPAARLSVRRGGWRVPHDVALVKAVDTATYTVLMVEAHDRGLSGGKRGDWLIAHLARSPRRRPAPGQTRCARPAAHPERHPCQARLNAATAPARLILLTGHDPAQHGYHLCE